MKKSVLFLLVIVSLSFIVYAFTTTLVDNTGKSGNNPSIAVDSNDVVHISHADSNTYDLRYCNDTGGTWTCAAVTTGEMREDGTSIAIDSNDNIHIINMNTSVGRGLFYCNNSVGDWSCYTINVSHTNSHTDFSIAIDTDDKIHLISRMENDPYYCNNTVGDWSCLIVQDVATTSQTSIALNSSGDPHFVYRNASDVAHCEKTTGWDCETIKGVANGNWEYPSIAFDSTDKAHIAFGNDSRGLWYCNGTYGAWTCIEIEDIAGAVYNSIAIDVNDKAHIVSFNTDTSNMRYCNSTVGSWSCADLGFDYATRAGSDRNIAIKKGRLIDSVAFSDYVHMTYRNSSEHLVYVKASLGLEDVNVSLKIPLNYTAVSTDGMNFTANYTAVNLDLANVTYYVWNVTGQVYNDTGIANMTGTTNSTTKFIANLEAGTYEWNVLACGGGFKTVCNFADANFTFIAGVRNNSYTHNTSTYETLWETFVINVTWDNFTYSDIAANLVYNGSSYAGTKTGTGENAKFTKSLTINQTPNQRQENRTFYWEYVIDSSIYQNSSTYTQKVDPINWSLCAAPNTIRFLNITFKDEDDDSDINGTIDVSTWNYWLNVPELNRSYSYDTSANLSHYEFCFDPKDNTVNIDYDLQYSLKGYPQKTYSYTGSYTNITTNLTLYLLKSADGIYVIFNVVSGAGQGLPNVYVTAKRQISGTWTEVASGNTGDDGGVTFWLNPDYSHQFNFTKDGYDVYTMTITPTQPSYTVTLGGVGDVQNLTDYSRGVEYSIKPKGSTLHNRTTYLFNFSISSSYYDLDEWGFYLTNGTVNFGSNSSSTGTGGTLYHNITTGSNSSITMNYYWLISGNYTNSSRSWIVLEDSDFGFSIRTFFIDLKNYANQGMFGLNNFSLTLLVFFFIFIIIGGMCYVSGVYSVGAVLVELTVLVALFDIGFELIQKTDASIVSFPTVFIGLITIAYLLWTWKT